MAETIPGHFPNESDDTCGGCHDEWPCRGWLLGQMMLAQVERNQAVEALSAIAEGRWNTGPIYGRRESITARRFAQVSLLSVRPERGAE